MNADGVINLLILTSISSELRTFMKTKKLIRLISGKYYKMNK
jgi:hypothetical protein